uniref:G_PROTEIN_RECEP_F1_2 domain-containing protein n=1 Tax=Heterorhabditis bacteriophora TaxID=37862 RepID=A0A1I7WNW8_HETBA
MLCKLERISTKQILGFMLIFLYVLLFCCHRSFPLANYRLTRLLDKDACLVRSLSNIASLNLQKPNSTLFKVRVVVNIVCGLAALLGIPANIFVLIAIVYFRDMRTISNVYIFNIAVADLLFLAGTPIVVIQSNTKNWIFGSAVCKLFICGNGVRVVILTSSFTTFSQ